MQISLALFCLNLVAEDKILENIVLADPRIQFSLMPMFVPLAPHLMLLSYRKLVSVLKHVLIESDLDLVQP